MEQERDQALAEAEAAGKARTTLDRIAERLATSASARAAFGEPVERDGITVIPVARIRWGFGGGSGPAKAADEPAKSEGSGGGGGVSATPLGYIELHDGQAKFVRIRDITSLIPLVLVSGMSLWLVFTGLRRLRR